MTSSLVGSEMCIRDRLFYLCVPHLKASAWLPDIVSGRMDGSAVVGIAKVLRSFGPMWEARFSL
eukprot:8154633-Prorocentrum_lima.AAC.1